MKPLHNSDGPQRSQRNANNYAASPLYLRTCFLYACGRSVDGEKTEVEVEGSGKVNPSVGGSYSGPTESRSTCTDTDAAASDVWPESIITILARSALVGAGGEKLSRSSCSSSSSSADSRAEQRPGAWQDVSSTLCAESASNSCPSPPGSPERETPWCDLRPGCAHGGSAAVRRQHFTKCPRCRTVRSRSLGRSARRPLGAWHHNTFTAGCCFGGHSTKFASCGPPLRRASIGKGAGPSRPPARVHWTRGWSIQTSG